MTEKKTQAPGAIRTAPGGGGNEVKGGIVINQLRKYAEMYANHINGSVQISIAVWKHPKIGSGTESIEMALWDSVKGENIKLRPHQCNDIRNMGALIRKLIAEDNHTKGENEK
jgi:hypothetical protein